MDKNQQVAGIAQLQPARREAIKKSLRFALCGLGATVVGVLIDPVYAQQDLFVGAWAGRVHSGYRQVYIRILFLQDGTYSQQNTDSLGVRTMQMGHYDVYDRTIHLTVDRWEPEQLSHPPGSMFRYSFPQPETLILHDVNFGGTIVMTRVD